MGEAASQRDPCPDARSRLPPLLVVGCGNSHAGDDAAGIEIVRQLRARQEPGCEFLTLPEGGPDLLQVFDQADVILLVDATLSGAPPGTLYLVPLPHPGLEARLLSNMSTHGWGLRETLELARALGRPIPRMVLLGVEIGSLEPGGEDSPAVERAIEVAVESFSRLRAWLTEGGAFPPEYNQNDPIGEAVFEGELECA